MSRPLLSYLFKGQCVLAAAEFLLARLTSNEERKNRDWYVSPGKLLTPSRPSSFPLAPLAPSIPGHCPPQEPRSGAQDHRTAGSPGLGGTRRDGPGLGPASGTGLVCPSEGTRRGLCSTCRARGGGREGRDIPARRRCRSGCSGRRRSSPIPTPPWPSGNFARFVNSAHGPLSPGAWHRRRRFPRQRL